jgi:hypothetical protein
MALIDEVRDAQPLVGYSRRVADSDQCFKQL